MSSTEQRESNHQQRPRRQRGRDRGERGAGMPVAARNEEQRPVHAPQFGAPAAAGLSSEFSPADVAAPQRLESMGEPVAIEPQAQAAPEVRPAPPPPPVADPAEIDRALRESGLEMIQTRSGSQAAPSPEPEFVPAKRERRAPPPDLAEPLVQVETGRESSSPKD